MYHTEKSRPTQRWGHHRDVTKVTLVVLKKGTASRPCLGPTSRVGSAALWPQLYSLLTLELPQLPPNQPRAGFSFSFLHGPLLPARERLPWSVCLPPQEKAKLTPVTFRVATENSC